MPPDCCDTIPSTQHLFCTSMYAAGDYVYEWASALDNDSFAAFQEIGGIFDPSPRLGPDNIVKGPVTRKLPTNFFEPFVCAIPVFITC